MLFFASFVFFAAAAASAATIKAKVAGGCDSGTKKEGKWEIAE